MRAWWLHSGNSRVTDSRYREDLTPLSAMRTKCLLRMLMRSRSKIIISRGSFRSMFMTRRWARRSGWVWKVSSIALEERGGRREKGGGPGGGGTREDMHDIHVTAMWHARHVHAVHVPGSGNMQTGLSGKPKSKGTRDMGTSNLAIRKDALRPYKNQTRT